MILLLFVLSRCLEIERLHGERLVFLKSSCAVMPMMCVLSGRLLHVSKRVHMVISCQTSRLIVSKESLRAALEILN